MTPSTLYQEFFDVFINCQFSLMSQYKMSLVLLNTALCVYVCMCVLTNLCKPHRMSHYAANKLRMSNYAANKQVSD